MLVNPGFGKLDAYRKMFVTPPLNLAYIASELSDIAKIEIIDGYALGKTPEGCAELALSKRPDVVVAIPNNYCDFVMGNFMEWSKVFFNKIKTFDREIKTFAGGPFPHVHPGEFLKIADFVTRGDHEIVLKNSITALENPGKWKDVKGLSYRQSRGIHLAKPFYIENLDSISFPARNLLNTKLYRHVLMKSPLTTALATRGCPYKCVFCTRRVYGPYRERSVNNVMDGLKGIESLGVKNIIFYDDNFTFNMKRSERICEEVMKEGLDISWGCATRVDKVNENLLRKMKKAGCSFIAYGVESGEEKTLENIEKGTNVEMIKKAFYATNKVGIRTFAYVILGLPGETRKGMERSFNLAKMLKPDYVQFNPLEVYPGSEIYDNRFRMDLETIRKIQKRFYARFYLNPKYLHRHVRNVTKADFKNIMRALRYITG